jgi:hypothetical protein
MAYGTRAAFEPVREIAFGSVGASYTAVGTPIVDHARLVRIVNTMNTEMYISLDAVDDHIRMAAGSFFLIDFSANKVRDDGLFLPIGTIFYVKQVTAPASGNLWIEVLYAQGGV